MADPLDAWRRSPGRPFPGVLPYHEGQPIPPGYHRDTRIRTWAVAAGASTLCGLWLVSATIAAGLQAEEDDRYVPTYPGSTYVYEPDVFWPLAIPVVGPFVAIETAHAENIGVSMLLLDGLVQTAGAVGLVLGVALPSDVLVWKPGSGPVAVRPGPAALGAAGPGLGLSGSF
ncbi:MAG: hypothetical protein HY744_09570 [Deltaproteobacteria bacterium]|nr:hypothetical protein [Deltaproteobacteria bacterium]